MTNSSRSSPPTVSSTSCFRAGSARQSGSGRAVANRNAAGVIGLKFKKAGDELVARDIARWRHALHITEQGFGKRTSVDEYPTKGKRMGVVGIKIVDEKAWPGTPVDDDDEVPRSPAGRHDPHLRRRHPIQAGRRP